MDEMTTADEELFEAVRSDKLNEVRNLLRRTADIATKNKDGDTILHLAASKGKEKVVQELIRADKWKEIVNVKDAFGGTALHNCAISGHTGTIEILLENGANAAAKDQEGWTALHHAAGEGRLAAVKCLTEHMKKHNMGCDQKTNKTGGTALHIAADRGFARIVHELLENGASNTATTWDGDTVLHWVLRGAITQEHGLSSEDEAEDESHDNDLNDETVNFEDNNENDNDNDGRSVPFVGRHQEGSAEDKEYQYDTVFEHILRGMNDKTKWSELLKVARREEKEEPLDYLMNKMYPQHIPKGLEKRLRRIWLAMSEARTQELMEMLREEMPGSTENSEKWDILSLATSLGKDETVYWLLRGRRWSKSEIDKARNLPNYDRRKINEKLSQNGEIWNTPFVHDERSGGESYRRPDRPELDRFGATIMDFHMIDNQIVSIYRDCDLWSLMDPGPNEIMNRSMKSLRNQKTGGEMTDEYSAGSLCYRWIHLASNSIPWMKDLAMVSYLDKTAKGEGWIATWKFLRRTWQELPENRDEESYMRPSCLKANLSQPKSMVGEQSTAPKHGESSRLALYMPYLTFGPFEDTSPHDKDLRSEHSGSVLHRSRTLDQFFHSTQDSKRARDKNQVFTRYVDRKLGREEDRKTSKDKKFDILRVNQLWLWVIDEKTIITSTTHRLDESEDPVFQGFLKRLFQSQTMFNREVTPSSVDSFVKLIASFYINALDNLKVSLKVSSENAQREGLDYQSDIDEVHRPNGTTEATRTYTASLTRVFADSIEYNNEKEWGLRENFRNTMNNKTSRSGDPHGSILLALEILDEIKDIRDELNIINSVVQEQKTVWSQLFNQSRGSSTGDDTSKEGYESYQWSNTDPDYVLKRVKDLLHEAEKTEHNIASVLELEMNQLNVSEAEEARMQGEEARKQGKILMAFTIVTVVFVPLSFLASLFALNISTFPHAGNDVQYHPGWIFGIMFGVTLAFILIILPFTVFQEAFSRTLAEISRKFQELLGKAPRPTGPQRDETRQTAGRDGLKSLKEWLQHLWGRLRRANRGGEPATSAAARYSPGDPGV